MATFSQALLSKSEAKSATALERIAVAKVRVQSVLDREVVAHQRTLEQKISEQGPTGQRVDPHLVGLAVFDLIETKRLRRHEHPATGSSPWYANPGTATSAVQERLATLAPLYASISQGGFGNLTGDALEVIANKCLQAVYASDPRFSYLGHFHLDKPKNKQNRYDKVQPPKQIGPHKTLKEADFIQFGHAAGPLCIECKNYRQWLYPHETMIKELIVKSYELCAIPVLVARRIHYSTRTNFLQPAGIIAHESLYHYYPADEVELAAKVSHKRSLGFTDVVASEEPHPRTQKFFQALLPKIVPQMAPRWNANREILLEYAQGEVNLAQLYTAIGSPAGGKWQEYGEASEWSYD